MIENDVQLIYDVLSGDDTAFTALVRKYQKSVHALAWRKVGDFHYAEEITQDTFLQVYKKLSTLKNPHQFPGWLYVMTNRLCLNWLRDNGPALQSLETTPMEDLEKSAYAHHVSEQREIEATEHRQEIAKKLLEKLPESECTVMTLYYLGEMTTKEISKFLGVSVHTITSRLQRARRRLQQDEERLVQEILGRVQLPDSLTNNIVQEVAALKLAPAPTGKPLLPWAALGAAAILMLLLLGFSNKYLSRFQRPYSFEAASEPTIEIIEAPIVLETDAKPAKRNQVGRATMTGKISSAGLHGTETVSTPRAPVQPAETNPWMPDPALRDAIREQLSLPAVVPLTKERLRQLRQLHAGGKGITDLKGLEFAQNLVELHLGNAGNYITDLSPLATLTSLIHLNIGGNQVADLKPLTDLTHLTGLSLWQNRVTDVSPLNSLTALTYLNLADNYVSDLRPLAHLIHLDELDLFDNEIVNITPLRDLKNLRHLILTDNHIQDLSPLDGLTQMEVLRIKGNPIEDLWPLFNLNLRDLKYDAVPDLTAPTPSSEAWMPDPALRAAVRGELGLLPGVPLTKEKLPMLHYLDADQKGVRDITGLAFATNLGELHLSENPITDLRPLAKLTQLESLDLWGLSPDMPNLDLRPLAELINLEELSLGRNRIADIQLLIGLKKLRTLDLSYNEISDIHPLAVLADLEELSLKWNRIADTHPLAQLKKLRTLDLSYNNVSDISLLAGLAQLRTLWIKENLVTDFTRLSELNLTDLKYDAIAEQTPQTRVSEAWMPDPALRAAIRGELGLLSGVPLTKEKMLRLEYLYAEGKGIHDITGLGFATNLRELYLNKNPITDLQPLVNLTKLETLHIRDLAPTATTANLDIRPLGNLMSLKKLTLQRNGISDITPLSRLTQLQTLGIEGNPITDLSPLFKLKLTELDLSNSPLTDLRQLASLTSLEYLCLEKSQISDISPLAELKRLRTLDIRYNAIENINPLAELAALRRLWIQGNPITDLSPLSGLPLTDFRYD
ncbi:hypothetical protein C6503_06835 [Candidatus Poribacteria bacterium]|nr:MAG: hypothetical protein C6503_06835 [Candidatus Poribacteria bacterium]